MIPLATLLASFVAEALLARTDLPGRLEQAADDAWRAVHTWLLLQNWTWSDAKRRLQRLQLHDEIERLTGWRVIESGHGRIALTLPGSGGVLKLDMMRIPESGNLAEIEFWELARSNPWWRARLLPILAHGRSGGWVLMPYAEPMPRDMVAVRQLQDEIRHRPDFLLQDIRAVNMGLYQETPRLLDYERWDWTKTWRLPSYVDPDTVQWRSVGSLIPTAELLLSDPRSHKRLCDALEAVETGRPMPPLAILPDGRIVGDDAPWRAARQLRLDLVPVVVMPEVPGGRKL